MFRLGSGGRLPFRCWCCSPWPSRHERSAGSRGPLSVARPRAATGRLEPWRRGGCGPRGVTRPVGVLADCRLPGVVGGVGAHTSPPAAVQAAVSHALNVLLAVGIPAAIVHMGIQLLRRFNRRRQLDVWSAGGGEDPIAQLWPSEATIRPNAVRCGLLWLSRVGMSDRAALPDAPAASDAEEVAAVLDREAAGVAAGRVGVVAGQVAAEAERVEPPPGGARPSVGAPVRGRRLRKGCRRPRRRARSR